MWKTAIILSVAIFITTTGFILNGIDCHGTVERINNAKEQLTGNYTIVYQLFIDTAEIAYGNFTERANFLANEVNDTMKKINDEIEKLFENSSAALRKECHIYNNEYLGGAALAVRENVKDCVKETILHANEKFSGAFSCLLNALENLDYQKTLAGITRNDNYIEILNAVNSIVSITSANITAEYETAMNTIGSMIYFDDCINGNTIGYKLLCNAAPSFIAETKRCIRRMSTRGH